MQQLIEQAAFEAGLDITLGAGCAGLRTCWKCKYNADLAASQYLMERLPQTLLAPDLQMTRIDVLQRAMQRDPEH